MNHVNIWTQRCVTTEPITPEGFDTLVRDAEDALRTFRNSVLSSSPDLSLHFRNLVFAVGRVKDAGMELAGRQYPNG